MNQSPKGQKSYEFGGVGLGIVVALDKSEDGVRGEKAFCSEECRSGQIMMDERKEKYRSSELSMELSSSPHTKDQIFSTGIMVI
ncbi:hypothetical protein TSUD_400700 [Trifolium subterraneum]|uniref:FLZ-type domain-containing protein n=1 Tax=Trifolium subterraneum TaxID=3900 RepID=A0A2Z6PK95_TRISU|nr:hypothetical protein TSUD_400700 [Trifolium subterraneum]